PFTPLRAFSQVSVAVLPIGVSAPTPVTTTLLLSMCLLLIASPGQTYRTPCESAAKSDQNKVVSRFYFTIFHIVMDTKRYGRSRSIAVSVYRRTHLFRRQLHALTRCIHDADVCLVRHEAVDVIC